MIEENVRHILHEIEGGNGKGEKITLVAATKTRTPEEICRAVQAGIGAVGENKVQEFCAKFGLIDGAERHFIGNLQTNKVKYLIGRCDLIHSVGSMRLAEEISRQSVRANVTQNILIEINVGGETSKGGFPYEEAESMRKQISALGGISVRGFMAMLPESGDLSLLAPLALKMRNLFEAARERDDKISFLSMGMSGDWRLCVEHGSNMIRLGTAIFGERNYAQNVPQGTVISPSDGE